MAGRRSQSMIRDDHNKSEPTHSINAQPPRPESGGPRSQPLPLIGIAGTRGKSTVAWMLTSIFEAAGKPSAAWLSSGVYVDGDRQLGELGPWSRVVLAARHGEIDFAIQEMDATTVVGAGLPENSYPLAVLTTLCGNNEACLLTEETEMVRRALDAVVGSVRGDGRIIVNADDYDVAALGTESSREGIFYALNRENPILQRHLENDGHGGWIDTQRIMYGTSQAAIPIIAINDIPATLDGTILFQSRNALAAVCAAMALGISVKAVSDGLRSYQPLPDRQPGASNIIRYNQATILIDAPREIGSLRMLARGIRHTPHRRTIVVTGGFPGLPDDEVPEAGRLLGGLAGIVLLHSENTSDARMELIHQGIAAATVPPIVLRVVDEAHAIDHLLNSIAPNDAALVIVDDPAIALGHLWPAPRISVTSRRFRQSVVGSIPT